MPKTARDHIARLRSFVGYDDVGATLLKVTRAAADLQSARKDHLDTLSAMRAVVSTRIGLPKDIADTFIEGMARAVAERALRIGRTLAESGNARRGCGGRSCKNLPSQSCANPCLTLESWYGLAVSAKQ